MLNQGGGDFQNKSSLPKKIRSKIIGKWLVRCHGCKGLGNKPLESSPFYKIFYEKEVVNK
jgi:hypothetical protein